jgi:hypothetical protein
MCFFSDYQGVHMLRGILHADNHAVAGAIQLRVSLKYAYVRWIYNYFFPCIINKVVKCGSQLEMRKHNH